eukprot:COSAG04_NODE_812_length_10107_cov_2.942946_2_plen_124_part_00
MLRLDGKRALVTGGGTGIGFGCAELFARQGASVAISGRRLDVLEEAAEKLAAHGVKAVAIQGDVSDAEEAQGMVRQTIEQLGGIEILVNSAGSVDRATSLSSTIEGWRVDPLLGSPSQQPSVL